jgi:protein-S-isoprenylcysteine O-methyltransferase Ste14
MDLIGKSTLHPVLFYTGKIAGYFTWILLILSVLDIFIITPGSPALLKWISYLSALIAILLIIWSAIDLGESTRLGLPKEQTVLKTKGIYRLSRNPMYLGFDLLTLSSVIFFYDAFILILGLYSILIYHFIILGEEKFLTNRFGKEFLDFKKKTRRYL